MSETGISRLLVVDDHPAIREALSIRIDRESDLTVCGEASDVAEALQMIKKTKPDLAVVDLSLKTGSGIELIKRVQARSIPLRLLVWSMHDETLYAQRVLEAGALGYVSKQAPTDQVIEAIRTVLAGSVYLSPNMTARVLQRAVGGSVMKSDAVETLSDRELETFDLIGRGRNTQQIAEQMHLSTKTIETYRQRIKQKLGINNSNELVQRATQWVIENR